MAATATPIVILAGVLLAWIYARRAHKGTETKKRRPPVFQRSVSLAALHGGKLALERLIDYQRARAVPDIHDNALSKLQDLLSKDRPNFYKLQSVVGKLEMSGKEEEALNTLERALAKARKNNKSHEAYEIEMSLVEMNIYKGDYVKASKYSCLREEAITDARRPLYLAIISIMRNERDTASKYYWGQFKETRNEFFGPPAPEVSVDAHKLLKLFVVFENAVKTLKEDIDGARKVEI